MGYDGVIAPYSPERYRAEPLPVVRELIDAIASTTHTEVVIVGGRPADEIRDLLRLCPTPEIWGANGLEHVGRDGALTRTHITDEVRDSLALVAESLDREGLDGCLELKHGAIAVHWRELPMHLAGEVRAIAARIFESLHDPAFIVQPFDGGLELRCRDALKALPFHSILSRVTPGACMAYIGGAPDDEELFPEVQKHGLAVTVQSVAHVTTADLQLRSTEDVAAFLFDWLCAVQGGSSL